MAVDNQIPFYTNTPDATHCRQASLKMVIEHFYPERVLTFDELDVITHKVPDEWTWQMAGLLWLQENGFEVIDIEGFDFERFIAEGGEYLKAEFGEEVALEQIAHSNIESEREISKRFLEKVNFEKRSPGYEDVTRFLDNGYLLTADINQSALLGEEGYVGHTVVIKGYDDAHVILNDPGPDALENFKVPRDLFMKAWAYPNEKALNLSAIRRSL